jgi:hypothetical protein
LKDGDKVELGGSTLVAHLTPGHTKGCTTWTMQVEEGGKKLNAVIIGSPNVNAGYVLVGNKNYPNDRPGLREDFKGAEQPARRSVPRCTWRLLRIEGEVRNDEEGRGESLYRSRRLQGVRVRT